MFFKSLLIKGIPVFLCSLFPYLGETRQEESREGRGEAALDHGDASPRQESWHLGGES